MFEFLFDVCIGCQYDKCQHIGVGDGVFLVQREEQMLTEVTLTEQLYADVLVLIVGQRNPFRRLLNADGTQLVINVVNAVRQFENEGVLFIADNRGNHIAHSL